MADEESGEPMTPEEFESYLVDLVTESKAIWGDQIEAAALAAALRRPLTIFRAADEPLTLGAEHSGAPLLISWHKHYYGLGAHYNSVVPL